MNPQQNKYNPYIQYNPSSSYVKPFLTLRIWNNADRMNHTDHSFHNNNSSNSSSTLHNNRHGWAMPLVLEVQ